MPYEIRTEECAAIPLAVVRRRASKSELPKVIPEACGLVWNAVKAQNVTGAGRHVCVYYDFDINLEVGVELPSPFAGHGEVIGSATPAGLAVTTTHLGPYGQLHQAYQAIQQWCKDHGRRVTCPFWEIYGHWLPEWNNDPSKIVTDVYYMLEG